ncbi:hypothetical protein C922_01998 [Plasmodium inui San Antonio 1]|uniref:Uncharacterized protein n=1 Tax=Plasmodium inui San Antonio 1 TaxID=1237626 RepID=W7AFI3_9APIC|nr:hypothetical protein C922_01998 [Plasmodium inui San Antonio 1]EUD67809.1 hypothetical protein C922_01998 [Plasmodium inui San Antonio 1]
MKHFDQNQVQYVRKQKKIRKCHSVWQKIIRKSLGCTKEEIKKSIANSKREKERVISVLYGSVFRGNKYLLYTKKWRGNTLNEIINQDRKNYMNLKNLKTVDSSYFCKLAFGYVDQNDRNNFKKTTQAGQLKDSDPKGDTSAYGGDYGNANRNGDGNANGDDNGNAAVNTDQNTEVNADVVRVRAITQQSGPPGGYHSNRPTTHTNAKKTQPNHSNIITRKKTHQLEKNTPMNEKDEVYETLNYLEKRSYRNRSRGDNENCLNGGTNSSTYYYYSNNFGSGSANFNCAGKYYTVSSNDSSARNANNRSAATQSNPNDAAYCEPQSDENTMIKYKYLPTGVFYSRVSRSFIANWIDEKTKKQIKMPYKIAEFGIEKCMILAILSRNLRISNLNNALKCYDKLTPDQKEKMLQVIRTTQKSEKLFNDLLKPNGRDPPNGRDQPNGRGLPNGRDLTNGKDTPDGRANPSALHSRTSPNGAANGQTNQVNVQSDLLSGRTDLLSGHPNEPNEPNEPNQPNQPRGQMDHLTGQPKQLTSLSSNSPNKNNEQESKHTPVKKTTIEKKKVKQSYNNSENLPTGVYFYQGSYVANWWETQQKKQFKVPFKISEHGIARAKNLAIISRIIRSSSVQQVNLILSQIEQTKNITKLNYAAIAALAFKYITPPPKEE